MSISNRYQYRVCLKSLRIQGGKALSFCGYSDILSNDGCVVAGKIGQAIARLRLKNGLTQQAVAARSNGRIKSSWLSKLEKGDLKYSKPTKLLVIAEVLGISLGDIYREAGYDAPPFPEGLTDEQRKVLEDLKHIPTEIKPAILRMLHQARSDFDKEPDEADDESKD